MKHVVVTILLLASVGVVSADLITGWYDATTDSAGGANTAVNMTGLTWAGTTYSASQLVTGSTIRYYNNDQGGVTAWLPEGSAVPADIVVIPNTSTAKAGDVGSKADNFVWANSSTPDISSIDALPYMETLFATPTNIFFVFERGGTDPGTVQAINADGSAAGDLLTLEYVQSSIMIDSGTTQFASGFVVQTDRPVDGIRISSAGFDALTICTIPEPATMSLLAIGGLLALRRRK